MAIHISINTDTSDEAIAEFGKIAKALNFFPQAEALAYAQQIATQMCKQAGIELPVVAPAAAAEPVTETVQEIIPPAPKEPKTSKKDKAAKAEATVKETAALLDDPIKDVGGAAETTDKAMDHDDARAALRALAAAKDMPTCSALLKDFGAAKAMEVPVDKIPAFVAKAAELAAA